MVPATNLISSANPLTHALILQFLESNKYKNTLAEFRKEANEIIENNPKLFDELPSKPLTAIVQDYIMEEMRNDVEKIDLENSKIDDDLYTPGTTIYPRYICETFSQIHSTNILTVRTQNIQFTNYNDNDYESISIPMIITGSADKSIKFTSLLTGDIYNVCDVHKGGVLAIDFHPIYTTMMLSASMDGSVTLIDASTMEVKQMFNDHNKFVVRAKFSPDGSMFFTASYDHTLNIYSIRGSSTPRLFSPHVVNSSIQTSPLMPTTPPTPLTPSTPLPIYSKIHTITFDSNIESLCILPNSSYLIVGIRDSNYLHYVNLQQHTNSKTQNFEITKHNMNANGDDWVSFTAMDIIASPNNGGKYLLVATDDENGRIIMFKTFNTTNCGIGDQQNEINKNEGITSSTLIQLANFYDIPSPESSPISSSPTIPSIAISRKFTNPRLLWHSSGKYFYACGIDAYPRVYSIESKRLIEKLKGHVNNNGDSKISNSESDNDKLCGHSDVVRGMWYDEERDLLITCGFDKCVKIWGSDELCRELMKDLKEEGEKKRIQGLFVRRNTII
ncbi:WD40-repeat-containing domain protein [Gigaspora rosea]|uniref:WD40-repeat-containing domain protein n=1 Tax=Gigaspora rosea TaxID=44941 RepID=A0A397VMP3_9GLOM|nr:WD40-repeat-containing domain protein [Gigaspora rosea]